MLNIKRNLLSFSCALILYSTVWGTDLPLDNSAAEVIRQQDQEFELALFLDQIKDLKYQTDHINNALMMITQLQQELNSVHEQLNMPVFSNNPSIVNKRRNLEAQLLDLKNNPQFIFELQQAKYISELITTIIVPPEEKKEGAKTLRKGSSFSNPFLTSAFLDRNEYPSQLSFSDLPDELIIPIINLVEGKDLLAAASTCRTLHRIIDDDEYLLRKRSSRPEHRIEMLMYFAEPVNEIRRIYGSMLQAVVRTKGGIFFNESYFELKQMITGNPLVSYLTYSNHSLNLIPREINRMAHLESLNLSYNHITWLPAEICQLPNNISLPPQSSWSCSYSQTYALRFLNLSHNRLTKLPDELCNLVGLQELNVSHNLLQSLPHNISKLEKLYTLNIGYNLLSNCGNIGLRWERIGQEQEIFGTVIAEHNRFTNTRALIRPGISPRFFDKQDYSHNQLTEVPEVLSKYLNLSYNSFTQLNLSDLSSYKNVLESVDLSHNNITALTNNYSIEDLARRTSSLKTLNLSHNQLTSLHEGLTAGFQSLQSLDLSHNTLSSLPSSLFNNKYSLSQLNLSYNRLYHFSSSCPSTLSSINLSHNCLGNFPQLLFSPTLLSIDLSYNQLKNNLSISPYLQNLSSLNLSHNHLTRLPEQIRALTSLVNLNLNATHLTEFPVEVVYLTRLGRLTLNENQLSGLHDSIIRLTNLTQLDLKDNKFTRFPEEILYMSSIYHLVLAQNQIESLPCEATQLTRLNHLDMRNNPLKRLPLSVARLQALKIGHGSP